MVSSYGHMGKTGLSVLHSAFLGRENVGFFTDPEREAEFWEHSQLVASYALLLAKALAIREVDFLRCLELSALFHDIGKMGVPPCILMKREPLSRLELRVIQEHPLWGYEMMADFGFLREVSRVVLYHHERCDGRGYPFGIAGASIPFPARILAVADALEAMTSNRPYRLGRSFGAAAEEIRRCRGAQFDPDIVEAFLTVPAEIWIPARQRSQFSRPVLSH
jgi:putative nucleotidyltransferase with HDIG domain